MDLQCVQCGACKSPSTFDHLRYEQCVNLCSFAPHRSNHCPNHGSQPRPFGVCEVPTFSFCVPSFNNKKICSLSPQCHEMKFKSLLSSTFRNNLSFLTSFFLLSPVAVRHKPEQGVPPGNPGSPGDPRSKATVSALSKRQSGTELFPAGFGLLPPLPQRAATRSASALVPCAPRGDRRACAGETRRSVQPGGKAGHRASPRSQRSP